MKILLIGSTGLLGKEVLQLGLKNGFTIVGASRKSSPPLNIDDVESIEEYFAQSAFFDAIICVAGHGSWGKLNDLSDEQIMTGVNSKLTGQVNVVRKGLKKLNPNGIIILTGGLLAYNPWLGTSNIAMANGGLTSFVKAVALELDHGKRISIVHPPAIRETAVKMRQNPTPFPPAAKVAEAYIETLSNPLSGNAIFVEGYEPK